MFGIGVPELLIILAIALIVIGPKKLPDLAKSLGRALNEFKKATREFKDSLDIDEDIKNVKKPFSEINKDIRTVVIEPPDQKKSTAPASTSRVDQAPITESPENIKSTADHPSENGKQSDD